MVSKTKKSLFVKAAVPVVTEQKQKNLYYWGDDDRLPNDLIRKISDSATATQCVSRLKSFIVGTNFVEESARNFQINKTQNAAQLLADIAPSSAIFEAVALRVLFNMQGLPGAIYRVPLKTLRKTMDGRWVYNKRKGEKDYKESENIFLNEYKPGLEPVKRIENIQKEIAEYGQQVGEIFIDFQIKEVHNGDVYPIPDCYSGLEDIESDAALQRLDKRNIKKGFKAQVVVSVPGELDHETKDDEGKTEVDYLKDDLRGFTSEEGNSVLVLESKVGGQHAQVTPFPLADTLNGTAATRDRIPRAVARHFSVPPVLIGLEVATILGNTQALVNSLKMFMLIVQDRQAMISRMLTTLFPDIDWTIGKANIFEFLPPEVLAKLTEDELRALGNYKPIEKQIPTEQETILNTLNTLSPLLSAEIVKRMPDNELFKLIGLNIENQNPPTP